MLFTENMEQKDKEKFDDELGITPNYVIERRRNEEREARRAIALEIGAIK